MDVKKGDYLISTDLARKAIVRKLSLGHAAWLWARDVKIRPGGSIQQGRLILSNLSGWIKVPNPEED